MLILHHAPNADGVSSFVSHHFFLLEQQDAPVTHQTVAVLKSPSLMRTLMIAFLHFLPWCAALQRVFHSRCQKQTKMNLLMLSTHSKLQQFTFSNWQWIGRCNQTRTKLAIDESNLLLQDTTAIRKFELPSSKTKATLPTFSMCQFFSISLSAVFDNASTTIEPEWSIQLPEHCNNSTK